VVAGMNVVLEEWGGTCGLCGIHPAPEVRLILAPPVASNDTGRS
jgi:hypothetical protein